MSELPPVRPNYFEGRLLDLAAFVSEQQFLMGQRQRLNETLFTSGVVHGLEVKRLDKRRVLVSKGMAFDESGQEILLEKDQTLEPGALAKGTYRLTIAYSEALTAYSPPAFSPVSGTQIQSTGSSYAPGYQLMTQIPLFNFQPGNKLPEHEVVLALVSFNDQGQILECFNGSPTLGRRHAGARTNFVTFSLPGQAPENWPEIQLSDKDTLKFEAQEMGFSGPLTLRGPLMINDDCTRALLTVIGEKGHSQGTMTTVGTSVYANSPAFDPALILGEALIGDVPGSGLQLRTVVRLIAANHVLIDTPFSPANQSALPRISNRPIARFATYEGTTIGEVLDDGSVNLGLSSTSRSGFTLNISSSGNVGIGLPASNNRLEVGGAVVASKFVGNGAKLTGIQGVWTAGNDGKTISYTAGNVGIGTSTPRSTLEVQTPAMANNGQATITSNGTQVLGNGSYFLASCIPGDFILLSGSSQSPTPTALITAVLSNSEIQVDPAFDPPISSPCGFQIQPPVARFSYKDAPVGTPPVLVVGPGNRVGVNVAIPTQALEVGGSLNATDFKIGETSGGTGGISADLLIVSESITIGTLPDQVVLSYSAGPPASSEITANTLAASQSVSAANQSIQFLASGSASAPLAIADTSFGFSSGDNALSIDATSVKGASLLAQAGLEVGGSSGTGITQAGELFAPTVSLTSLQLGPANGGLQAQGTTLSVGNLYLSQGAFQTSTSLAVSQAVSLMQNWIPITSFNTKLVAASDGILFGYFLGSITIGNQPAYSLGDTYNASYSKSIFWITYEQGSTSGAFPAPFSFSVPKGTNFTLTVTSGSNSTAFFIPLGDQSSNPQPAS